jgi:hypothetical protein
MSDVTSDDGHLLGAHRNSDASIPFRGERRLKFLGPKQGAELAPMRPERMPRRSSNPASPTEAPLGQ